MNFDFYRELNFNSLPFGFSQRIGQLIKKALAKFH